MAHASFDQESSKGRPGSAPHRSAEFLDQVVLGVLATGQSLSAYQVSYIAAERGTALSAMQVYRVMERLTARGFVQRIESINAYALAPGEDRSFAVCTRCRASTAIKVPDARSDIRDICGAQGFSLSTVVLEASGLCKPCANSVV